MIRVAPDGEEGMIVAPHHCVDRGKAEEMIRFRRRH
jgi:hypothetical protein